MIKTDLSGFVVTMHSGLCEQYVKSLRLRRRDLTSCFARALVHYDNNPSRAGLNPTNNIQWRYVLIISHSFPEIECSRFRQTVPRTLPFTLPTWLHPSLEMYYDINIWLNDQGSHSLIWIDFIAGMDKEAHTQ